MERNGLDDYLLLEYPNDKEHCFKLLYNSFNDEFIIYRTDDNNHNNYTACIAIPKNMHKVIAQFLLTRSENYV